MFSFGQWFKESHPTLSEGSVNAVLELAAEGATIPFMARYRKERTGNLDEVAIGAILSGKETWDTIIKRQAFIAEEIERQGKLTDELKGKLASTFDLDRLEDLYLPYKIKRKTKAQTARDAGLLPLADWLWAIGHGTEEASSSLADKSAAFVNAELGVKDAAAALDMAKDILVERLSEDVALREFVRITTFQEGSLRSKKTDKSKPASKFEAYFSYDEKIKTLLDPKNSHRYLAVRRGWLEEELSISFGAAIDESGEAEKAWETKLGSRFEQAACSKPSSEAAPLLHKAARLALRVYVLPSIETEVHKALREVGDAAAIDVFANNLRTVLLAAPYGAKAVLGVDPGIRTGCKLAVVDERGAYVTSDVIHLHSDGEKNRAKETLGNLVKKHGIRAVAVGNGTAGRETEAFVREALSSFADPSIPVVMVSESGASIYSASEIAREEHPDLDLTIRGAISIARRFQDPLAELVKLDPKSIGVGQYQHDVSQTALKKSLDGVVDSAVNSVGVNVNTASQYLLSRVAGIGSSLARSIVTHRATKGIFRSRKEIREVPRFSDAAFEQAAGFLRVPDSESPLDNTGIHPERYEALTTVAARLGKEVSALVGDGATLLEKDPLFRKEVGDFTFKDIVLELKKPGRDPRATFEAVQFREDVRDLSDLKPGLTCPGVVTNVTNFGAFVDIGVHQDGLVHVSKLADRFVSDPREVVKAGDRVSVRVLEVDLVKKRISLSMRSEDSRSAAPKEGGQRPTNAQGARRGAENKAAPMAFKNDALQALSAFRAGAKEAVKR